STPITSKSSNRNSSDVPLIIKEQQREVLMYHTFKPENPTPHSFTKYKPVSQKVKPVSRKLPFAEYSDAVMEQVKKSTTHLAEQRLQAIHLVLPKQKERKHYS
ncbi:hypothetical protein K7432_017245, partial [Basidiobolus ranarum]